MFKPFTLLLLLENGDGAVHVGLAANHPINNPTPKDKKKTAASYAYDTHRLLSNVVVGAHQKAHEYRHGSLLDDYAGVVARAASNVGQRPGGLELQRRVVISLEELDELRHHAGVNHVLDRRVSLCERCGWVKHHRREEGEEASAQALKRPPTLTANPQLVSRHLHTSP